MRHNIFLCFDYIIKEILCKYFSYHLYVLFFYYSTNLKQINKYSSYKLFFTF